MRRAVIEEYVRNVCRVGRDLDHKLISPAGARACEGTFPCHIAFYRCIILVGTQPRRYRGTGELGVGLVVIWKFAKLY